MNEDIDWTDVRRYDLAICGPEGAERLPDRLRVLPLVPPRMESCARLMPVLVDLRQAADGDGLAARLSDAVLLRTGAAIEEVVRHWNAMQLARPLGGRRFWLRLHDPRVLHQMLRILRPGQRRRLFGRAERLAYALGGEWTSVAAGARDDADEGGNMIGWDWRRIEQIGIVNRALQGAAIRGPAALLDQGARAERLLELGKTSLGMWDAADLVEFCVRGLGSVDGFESHPEVARALRPDPESRLADRFALVGEHVWKEVHKPMEEQR